MRMLEVWLADRLVGTIEENRKGGRFAYRPEIASQFAGMPLLSLCLPVKARPFGEARTRNWFEGLLPEGRRRQDVCRSLGLSEYDWIGLLGEIGWECAGAVRIFAQGAAEGHPAGYAPLSSAVLAEKLADIPARMPQRSGGTFRMSLGGFQDKMCVCMPRLVGEGAIGRLDGVLLPEGDAPSTHILKPENARDYPGCAESEAWAMAVAGHAARTPRTALLKLDSAPDTLIVERYDRAGDGWPGGIRRLHQEDTCQALGLPPHRKYADGHGPKGDDPTYAAIAALLQRFAPDPREEMAELLRQLAVNMALGNWDAHAKNISLLYGEGMVPSVAPLYDVVPIAEVEARITQLSLRVAGSLDPASVTRASLVEEASGWGLVAADAVSLIDGCLERLEKGLAHAAGLYPDAAKRHADGVLRRMDGLA